MAVGRIFQQRTPCLRLAQSHCERVSASTRIPNTDLAWTLDALCPCKWRIGVVTKGACCWGGVHRFYAGIEGVIQHSSPCRSKNGASHREKCGHVTPKLGTAERQTVLRCLRRLTFAASIDWVNRSMSVVSSDDVCSLTNCFRASIA
jgi:hypothetical protein